ncbi:MAG TPA: tetratricopeptide repeat protein [Nitrospinaceae bacterium]|jgi:TolA-binding protein|nr:tetratricopeptide repeat protein [Nitrospinaceae bacterium]|tara:strand:+ start:2747 stop:3706 length:960 start_codon:yes stop_codon:yes gene_type:complete
MSELNRATELMPIFKGTLRLLLISITVGSIFLGGCSYIPWVGNDEDDLAFEEDFPFEDEQDLKEGEDDFFEEAGGRSSDDDFVFDETDDDFASIDQRTDKKELEGDVGTLQTQQEALIGKVRELEEVLASLGPKINATQEQLEGSLSAVSGKSEFLEPEVEELKLQVARLSDEINRLKVIKASNTRARGISRRKSVSTPLRYNQALSSYRAGNYDESILQFQSFALTNPPERLQDNIAYWIGSNYVKLEMYEDAITQFEIVINSYPRGNKVHDARFMLGRVYSLKGETSRAVEILQSALKNNPPAEVRGKISKQLKNIQ